MRVVYNGRDLGEHGCNGGKKLSLREERRVKDLTKLAGVDYYVALGHQDPDAMSALVVVMLERHGERVRLESVDGQVELEPNEQELAEASEQQTQGTHPVITQILRDLGVEVDRGEVADVVARRVRESLGVAAEGNTDGSVVSGT